MSKLLVAMIAGVFALGSSALMAQGIPPVKPEDTAKAKAEKEAAEQKEAKMTPEERKAVKKAAVAKHRMDLSHAEKVGNPNATARGDAIEKSAEATKDQPKLDKKARQEALKTQEKMGNPNATARGEAISKSAETGKDQPKQ